MPTTAPTTSGGVNTFGQSVSQGGGTIVPQSNPNVSLQTPGTMAGPTPASTPSAPTQPTTLTSANITEKAIPQTQSALQNYPPSGQIIANDGLVRNAGGSFASAPTGAIQNTDGTWTQGGKIYGLGPDTGQMFQDSQSNQLYSQMNDLRSKLDAVTESRIGDIQNQFQRLISQQEQANAGAQAATRAMLLRTGALQGTASGDQLFKSQVDAGLQRIADLHDKEQSAINAARASQYTGDMQFVSKALADAQLAFKEKQVAAQKLSDALLKQSQALQSQQQQFQHDDAISKLLEQGITDPKKIIDELGKQGISTTADKVSKVISELQNIKENPLTSKAIEWANEAAKNGADQTTINKALSLARSDPTQALSLLSGSLQDPLKAQQEKLKLEQTQASINKSQVDTERSKADIAKIKAETAKLGLETSKLRQDISSTVPVGDIKQGTPQYKVAQDLAYGNITMAQFRTLYSYSKNTNQKLAIYQKASELNPNFNPAAFELGYHFANNPKVRQQISSLDNVQNMIPEMIKLSDQATRTGTGLNNLVIKGGVALGSSRYSNMQTARNAFADELSGALGYGSATDMSREMGFNMTDTGLSAKQFKDGLTNIVAPFVQSKRGTLINSMGQYGSVVNTFSSGAGGQGSGMVKLKDTATGEVRSFSNLSPNDFQEAIKRGYTVVQ